MDATLDLWEIPPESARRVGHPAPFPVALPERLINLYTYAGDLVLDPFMGSGTTAVAAVRTGRHFVGYDTDPEYVAAATARVAAEQQATADTPVAAPQVPSEPADGEDVLVRARREGHGAKELTRDLLELAGFGSVEPAPKAAGIEMTFAVRDVDGRRLLIDLCGAFTSSRPGLKRPDTLWKALGRAGSVQLLVDDEPTEVVLVSTDVPARASTLGKALAAAAGPGGPVLEVVELDHAGLEVLGQLAKGLRPGDPGWSGSGWSAR
mgnify:CR=1 FL=1